MNLVEQDIEDTLVIVPSGMLGAGVVREHIRYGISRGAHAIAVDSGSTDSGPYYLARGVSKMNREAIKRDLEVLMSEAASVAIPILVGTCGTSGTDSGVDWTKEIAMEVARELGINPKIACLYSEQNVERLKSKNREGKITPLPPLGDASDALLDSCDHIVALMGPEPYIEAIQQGANIVLGGRTTDTAVLAAVPLMRGADVAASWHAAKTAECGSQCTVNPLGGGGVMMRVGKDGFSIEPLNLENACSPESVSAHMLYENSDPTRLVEPGGILDVSDARYEWIDDRSTKVSGSRWDPMPYTMKLEGARGGEFQTIMIIGIQDPDVLANLDEFHDKMQAVLIQRIKQTFGADSEFDLSLRIYGWNGTSGRPVKEGTPPPPDAGVMCVITAPTQDLANRMAKSCNPYFFHMPLRPGRDLPSYGFPFTPAEVPRGQVFEFVLNHVVHVDTGLELVRTEWANYEMSNEAQESLNG